MADAQGEIVNAGGTLKVTGIHVVYRLQIEEAKKEEAQKVHGFHVQFCPMAQTLKDCVRITTSLELTSS